MPDIVYVIGNPKTVSPFKIGSTKERLLKNRLSGIQTGNPIELGVLQTFLVPPDQETNKFEKWLRISLVKKFPKKYKHATGEWVELKTKPNGEGGAAKQIKLINDLKKVLNVKEYAVHKDVTVGYLIEKYSLASEEQNRAVKKYNEVTSKIFETLKESFDLQDVIEKGDEKVKEIYKEIDKFTSDRVKEFGSEYIKSDYGHRIEDMIWDRIDKETVSILQVKYPKFFQTSERKKIKINSPDLQEDLAKQAEPFLRWLRVFYNLFSSVVKNTHWYHSSKHRPYMFKFDEYSGYMPNNVTLTFDREETNTQSEMWTWSPGDLRVDTEYTVQRESPQSINGCWLGKFFVGGQTYIERSFEKRGSKELYDEITLDVGKKLASSPPPSNVYISYVGGREKYQREHYYSYNYCMENFGYNMSRKIGESVQKFIQQILKEEK